MFENFRNKCIEIFELGLANFLFAPRLAWQACLKRTAVKLELLTDIDMFLMVEKGIIGGMCQAIQRYAKANNKYMKSYDKIIESSYLMYLDANNLCGWAMSQKRPVNSFEWVKKLSKFDERFIKNYDENSLHRDLPFLPERKKIVKCNKLVCSFYYKRKLCCPHKGFNRGTKSWINYKNVHRVIQFNQKAWLRPYIDMNSKLRTEAKNDFGKDFFKLMNNAVFRKTMENVRKHRDIKLVTRDKRRNQTALEPNYHKLIIYLDISILDINKTVLYEFWYYYIKPK